jgi:hypothetical protein
VVKKVHVRVNEAGTLYFDFHFRGVRCKEYTRLTETPVNRKRCEKMAQIIANEIDLGKFDYLRYFPLWVKASPLHGTAGWEYLFRAVCRGKLACAY